LTAQPPDVGDDSEVRKFGEMETNFETKSGNQLSGALMNCDSEVVQARALLDRVSKILVFWYQSWSDGGNEG
jgi:hypothetical protein